MTAITARTGGAHYPGAMTTLGFILFVVLLELWGRMRPENGLPTLDAFIVASPRPGLT